MARTDGTARGEAEFTQTIPIREGRRLSQNEDIVNVFDKPDEQRPSLLGLCHGEKTKAKSTFSISQMSNDERGMSIAELWISYHSSHHIINKD